jgi:drug/metabolite transporter (DMT)-like permease
METAMIEQEALTEKPTIESRSTPFITRDLSVRWGVAFFAACTLVVTGHLLLKSGVSIASTSVHGATLTAKLLAFATQPLVVEGLLIYGLGSACWIMAVAQAEISVLYPLSSINYVLVAVFSIALFGETISFRRGLGVTIIALGMVLLTREKWQGK